MAIRLVTLLVAAFLHPACSLWVTFDPPDAGPESMVETDAEGEADAADDADDGRDVDVDVDVDVDADVDADADVDGDVETGPVCGDGVVEGDEECDGDGPRDCTTSCSTPGTQSCGAADCRWGPCETAGGETCNELDDDCDGFTDETFPCVQGRSVACDTICDLPGARSGLGRCTDGCDLPSGAACTPPAERCDGIDNDCDTGTDEDWECAAGSTVSCTTTCSTSGNGLCTAACRIPTGAACVPLAETCNRVDDDCDTLTDEGLWRPMPAPSRVTTSPAFISEEPRIAWNAADQEFGIAWVDRIPEAPPPGESDVYFARMSADGAKRTGDILVSTITPPPAPNGGYRHEHPSLAWSGTEWGFAWSDGRIGVSEIYFRRLTASGARLGDEVRITTATGVSQNPSLVWTGTEYGLAWNDGRDGSATNIYFARISSAGVKVGADVRVANTTDFSARPDMVWTDSRYGLTWYEISGTDRGNPYFTTVSGTGVPGSPSAVLIAPLAQTHPDLAWNGIGYGMVWLDEVAGSFDHVRFVRLDANGFMIGSPTAITSPAATPGAEAPAALAWSPTLREYVVAWADMRHDDASCDPGGPGDACGLDIFFARIAADGRIIDPAVRVTTARGRSTHPWLAEGRDRGALGAGFGLVWSDERDRTAGDSNAEIYYTELGCR